MPPFYMNIVRLLLTLALLTATAQAAELLPQAQEPYQKGLLAAQQQDWKLAVRNFRNAQKSDPEAPEIWFNLGLASSKLPGYEIRAIALFKAYLLANPADPRGAAIRSQIAALEAGFESKMAKIADQLESFLILRKAAPLEGYTMEVQQAYRRIATTTGWDLARIRFFMGDTSGALRSLRATNGEKWQEDWQESGGNVPKKPYTTSPEEHLAVSMAADGLLGEATSMLQHTYDQDAISFILEQGDVAQAQQFMNAGATDGWSTIACLAHYRKDNALLSDALAKAKADINDLVASGTCEHDLWWSVGRIGFLLQCGTDGIMNIDTQLAGYLNREELDSAHPGEASVFLESAAANIADLLREYRKIRGPASAHDDYAEAYYYRGNVYYKKGQYDRAIRNYDQALRLRPDYAEAINGRAKAQAKMTRPPAHETASAVR
ncbi:MAG: tetratricopeptide repeat protein [Geobacteraceae bacterium]|nr:tetratricopeptide repeat protein [Geobacteraceae bacterium]